MLSDLPAKLQSKRYKVKKTAVIVAPNQDFYIEYPSGIPSPDPDLERETLIISESKDQLSQVKWYNFSMIFPPSLVFMNV